MDAERPILGRRLIDVLHRVTDGEDGLGRIVRNFDAELFFEGHDEFDRVETVRAKIVDKARLFGDLVGVNAEMPLGNEQRKAAIEQAVLTRLQRLASHPGAVLCYTAHRNVRIDAEGRIHVAAYDTENGDNFSVRYLRIE